MTERIEKTMKNLEKNNINAYFVQNKEEVVPLIEKIVEEGSTVAVGGSVSLTEAGVLEHLRSGRYKFIDRYKEGLTPDEIEEVFRKSFSVDAYFCSSNAVTEEGELYNVDGNANRIGAIAFGPKKVVMVVGVNKIVENIDQAVRRVKTVAAPKNARRLNCKSYCNLKGHCMDMEGGIGKGCSGPNRICKHYLVSAVQKYAGRINVILVNQELGY
ncbi:MAG: lactate utilization protein [Clostridia bacterium]|nr:lactate utilization protein [Clostridia bacterium]